MENLAMHLITIISIVTILWVVVCVPWLVGWTLNRAIGSKKDHYFEVWGFGCFIITLIAVIVFFIYSAYIDIFTYYTKP